MILDLFLAFIDLIFGYFVFLSRRTREKKQEWYGTVEKKELHKGYSLSRLPYTVLFRIEDGKRKKLRMKEEDFNRYHEGRRYHKRIGEYLPDPESGI